MKLPRLNLRIPQLFKVENGILKSETIEIQGTVKIGDKTYAFAKDITGKLGVPSMDGLPEEDSAYVTTLDLEEIING